MFAGETLGHPSLALRVMIGGEKPRIDVSETLWFDWDHDFALRRHETLIGEWGIRVANPEFVRVSAGLFLPERSWTEVLVWAEESAHRLVLSRCQSADGRESHPSPDG